MTPPTRLARPRVGPRPAILALAALAALAPPAAALPSYHVPAPASRTLANGVRVLVFSDSRVPVAHVQLRVAAGLAQEPESQNGVANLTGQMLRQGTTSRDAQQFTHDLDAIGGSLLASTSREYLTLSGAFLSRDFETGLELLADLVLNPVFSETDFNRFVGQTARGIRQLHQNADATAEEQMWTLAMPGRAAARPAPGSVASVTTITRDQVRAFHRDHYRPQGALLVIAGDVTPERGFAAAEEWLGRWAAKGDAPAAPQAAAAASGVRVRIVDQPGPACVVRIGVEVPGRSAPDGIAREVAERAFDRTLGERFARSSSPLGRDARSSLLLLCDRGLWTVDASGPADSAATLVRRLRSELRRFMGAPLDAAGATAAKRAARRAFPQRFEPLAALMGQWVASDFCGMPADVFTTYPERIDALTPAALFEATRRGVESDRLAIVVVGPARTLERQLRSFGPVEVVQLDQTAATVNAAAPDTTPPPTTAERARGRELMAQAVAAHGGLEKLQGLTTSVVDADVTVTLQGNEIKGTLRQLRKEPYKMVYLTSIEGFTSRQILNGRHAWTVLGDDESVKPADSLEVSSLRSGFTADPAHLLLAGADPRARVAHRGRERIAARDVDVVEVVPAEGSRFRLYLDAADHRMAAAELEEAVGSVGLAISRRVYADFRVVNGITWPFQEDRSLRGQPFMHVRVTTLTINAPLGEIEFQEPKEKPPQAPTNPLTPR